MKGVKIMTDREQNIKTIIEMCEEIQDSNESAYTKECAKLTAYDHIKRIILEGGAQDGKAGN